MIFTYVKQYILNIISMFVSSGNGPAALQPKGNGAKGKYTLVRNLTLGGLCNVYRNHLRFI